METSEVQEVKTLLRRKPFQIMLLIIMAAAVIYAVTQSRAAPGGGAAIGDLAPAFELDGMDGTGIASTDFEGKGVVLNFWASWCNPCVNELPLLNEAYKLAGIDMIAINVGEDEETARKFAKRYDLLFPIAMDRELQVKKQYRAVGLPLTIVIDAEGRILERHEGELTDMSDILSLMGQIRHE
jgi:peroxiredoxin